MLKVHLIIWMHCFMIHMLCLFHIILPHKWPKFMHFSMGCKIILCKYLWGVMSEKESSPWPWKIVVNLTQTLRSRRVSCHAIKKVRSLYLGCFFWGCNTDPKTKSSSAFHDFSPYHKRREWRKWHFETLQMLLTSIAHVLLSTMWETCFCGFSRVRTFAHKSSCR